MALNLNHAIAQGYVVSVYEGNNNATVTLVVRDDYRNRDGDMVERAYFLPVRFFGTLAENLVNLVEKGQYLTVEFKVGSYKPDDSQYHVLQLVGISFYLTPRSNNAEEESTPVSRAKKNRNNRKPDRTTSNKRRPSKQEEHVEDDWPDDYDDLDDEPPWN